MTAVTLTERLPAAHRIGGGGPAFELDAFLSGHVFMDLIFTGLPGLPRPGTELVTDGLGTAPGGIANLAVAMTRLGLSVGLAAPFGDDLFGASLWRTLAEQERVDLVRSRRVPGWPTPVTVSLAYNSDRSMVTYARPVPRTGSREDPYAEVPGSAPSAPSSEWARFAPPAARACFIDVAPPVSAWAGKLRAAGTLVFADVGWDATETWSSEVLDRLEHVDVFLPNAVEAMAYTRTGSPEAAARALSGRVPVVVVKRGGAGAIAIDSRTGEVAEVDALPVRALDATGAGDVFGAGFLFGTLADLPLAERLRFANLCAGLSVRHRSGSLGTPCWGEIAEFMESGEAPEQYAFVTDHIPDSATDTAVRAEPTLDLRHLS